MFQTIRATLPSTTRTAAVATAALLLAGPGVANPDNNGAQAEPTRIPAAAAPPPVSAPPPSRINTVELADALPNAKPGECYAKVLDPLKLEPVEEKLVAREGSHRIEVSPPRYETTAETVLAKEAAHRLEVVDATYETVTESIELEPARRYWRRAKGKARPASDGLVAAARALGVPASAEIGQCFAEYAEPAKFETRSEKVLIKQAAHRIEVTEPKYEWVEEKVQIKQASHKLEVTPAKYETVTEKKLVSPATTAWKPGRGPTERVDNVTGEILCLVEIPAEYKTISKKVLKSPAQTRKVEIPAEFKTVKVSKLVKAPEQRKIEIPAEHKTLEKKALVKPASVSWRLKGSPGSGKATGQEICMDEIPARNQKITKRVLKSDAKVAKVEIPAKQQQVKVQVLKTPAEERRIEVPAEYQTMTRYQQISNERLAWRQVLCETNTSAELVKEIQRALAKEGFDPGGVDGNLGPSTMAAVDAYQRKKELARGGLTVATVKALGVKNIH